VVLVNELFVVSGSATPLTVETLNTKLYTPETAFNGILCVKLCVAPGAIFTPVTLYVCNAPQLACHVTLYEVTLLVPTFLTVPE
jgi:hypothetical protein